MKQLDENLPSELEEIINKYHQEETDVKLNKEHASVLAELFTKDQGSSHHASDGQEVGLVLLQSNTRFLFIHILTCRNVLYACLYISTSYII